ncbi:MAG: hypothetical protein EXR51_11735 [Dehalococcoidia bacterium]|nr:hypothetical protein [Dehalococcoidia bacterium]
MLKDVHLIEAALETSAVVLSLDGSAEQLFRRLAETCAIVCPVQWAHPVTDHERVHGWLMAHNPKPAAWALC